MDAGPLEPWARSFSFLTRLGDRRVGMGNLESSKAVSKPACKPLTGGFSWSVQGARSSTQGALFFGCCGGRMSRHAVIMGLLLALLSGCFQSTLSVRIGEQARAQGVVELAPLTDFEWDTVFIFSPYTSTGVICNAAGAQWPECERQAPKQVSESSFHLVFTHQGAFVSQVVHSRKNGNFCTQTCALSVPRQKAKFHVAPVSHAASSNEPSFYLLTQAVP